MTPPAATSVASAAGSPAPRVPLVPESARRNRAAVGFDAATLRRVTAMAFRHRARMTLALLATALAAASQVAIPRLIGNAVDHAAGLLSQDATALRAQDIAAPVQDAVARGALFDAAWLLFAAAAFRGACTMLQNYQGEAVGHLVAYELRVAFYAKLQRLSFRYHDRTHTGELMTRGILDIEGVRMWVHTGILRLVLLAILIGGGAAMLVSIDGGLALVALAFVPLVAVGATLARLRLRALWYALQEELGVLTRIMEENLGGIRVVRAYASQAFEMARFDAISSKALAILHRRIAVFVASTTSMTFVFFLAMGLVLWVGGVRVIEGRISLGELTAFLAFMTILQAPVRQIAWMVNSIARTSTCGQRLFEILDLEPDITDRDGAAPLRPGAGTLRFENVCFSYHAGGGAGDRPGDGPVEGQEDGQGDAARGDTADAPATLSDVSFEVRRGQVLGIVGPPGSGKSTIAHLIPRFYDVTAGRVTIDGQDVRDVTLDSLRGFVNVVQQDTYLFTAPVDTNVAYGDPWADRSAIRQASESAQLHQYIAHLPEEYRTLVGERGVSLSGGQRQRLAIARAVLPESGILVFDDSTAAVDAATEHAIHRALGDHMRERATIVIAHRLSSLMHADEILYLEAGRVVERGTHAELIALGGRYAALHALQTRAPEAAS